MLEHRSAQSSAQPSAHRSTRSSLARLAAGAVLSGGLVAAGALPAQADASAAPAPVAAPVATINAAPVSHQVAAPVTAAGSSLLGVAQQHLGTPYVWGGSTPAGFDCSGYTSYAFAQLGVSIPRTADAQLAASRRVSAAQARPGDLVFFTSGGRAYHVGIYAGNGMMYDAPSRGGYVGLRAMWTQDVTYGRFLA